jgi:sulfur carrier protein ThiS
MTVKELIAKLEKIKDKSLIVVQDGDPILKVRVKTTPIQHSDGIKEEQVVEIRSK